MASWGIDIDGCLYDFGASFRHYMESIGYDSNLMSTPASWDFYRGWGMSDDEFYSHMNNGITAGIIFSKGGIFPDALTYLRLIKKKGHSVNIVTHRLTAGTKSVHATFDWLKREEVPYDSLCFAKDKTIVRNDIFIEDNIENYLQLKEAGICAFLYSRLWNEHFDTPDRVESWAEFYKRGCAYLDEKGIK